MMLHKGQRVTVHNIDGGTFTGTVTDFIRNGHVAIITPDRVLLRAWFPKGYELGRAHWGVTAVPIPANAPEVPNIEFPHIP